MRTILLTSAIWLLATAAWGQAGIPMPDSTYWLLDGDKTGVDHSDMDSVVWDTSVIVEPHPKAVELLNPVTIFYVDTIGWTGKMIVKQICPTGDWCSITLMGWTGGEDPNYCMRHNQWDTTYVPVPVIDTIIIATFWIDAPYKRMNDWRVKQ